MTLASLVNLIFGILSIIAQLGAFALILSWLFGVHLPDRIRSHAITIAFSSALLATLGSLTYSEILGYDPCKLCWIQRIFMYPQTLILGLALCGKHKGDKALIDTSIVMSIVGALIALYHYLMQLGIVPEGSCAAIGYSVSCAERFVMQFGYITLPLMAFSAFLLIIVSLLLLRRSDD